MNVKEHEILVLAQFVPQVIREVHCLHRLIVLHLALVKIVGRDPAQVGHRPVLDVQLNILRSSIQNPLVQADVVPEVGRISGVVDNGTELLVISQQD